MLRRATRILGLLGMVGVMMGGLAGTSRAAFTLFVTENGGAAIPIVDGGALDNDGTVNGIINVNTGGLNALLADFQFNTLSGVSNALTGSGLDDATVRQTGDVIRTGATGTGTISIVALEDNFLFPDGNPKFMRTSASDTFTNTNAGDSRTFQSTFNDSINSPLLAFVPPTGPGPFSTSNPGVITNLGDQDIPFSLSNTTVITLGANNGAASGDQFTGATTVTAIPEPGAFALVLLGLPALVISRRVRRGAAA